MKPIKEINVKKQQNNKKKFNNIILLKILDLKLVDRFLFYANNLHEL